MSPTELHTPLGEEVLILRAGDRVTLSGLVYTARDEAHIMMDERGIPFDPNGAAIYHCGPIIIDGKVVAAGPTTSARMNNLSGFLLDNGVRALIGKGGMGETVREQLRGRGVYLAFTGGCAALAASCMKYHGIYYEELGMAEAVWESNLTRYHWWLVSIRRVMISFMMWAAKQNFNSVRYSNNLRKQTV